MGAPVNYQKRDPKTIESDCKHSISHLNWCFEHFHRFGIDPQGLEYLEFGPGVGFGSQLILSSIGVQVTLADRFIAPWDDDYHPALYRRMAELWDGSKDALLAAIRDNGYSRSGLTLLEEPAEDLASVKDSSMGFVCSLAVLEHIVDLTSVAQETGRVLRSGGYAAHLVDWRDHRNFDRPLEFLTTPDDYFASMSSDANMEWGNRYRPSEFQPHFEAAGLLMIDRADSTFATPDYFCELLPRLRRSASSYRNWPEDDLRAVSGGLFFRREEADDEMRTRSRASLARMDELKRSSLAEGRQELTTRLAANVEAVVELDASAMTQSGLSWLMQVPGTSGDTPSEPERSTALAFEDDRPLGPPHSLHESVRTRGAGRFSHWNETLYLSTSDNSSPAENGRRYTLRVYRGLPPI